MANVEIFACADCHWTGPENDMKELQDPLERCMPGDVMPYGECPECGAACFPAEKAEALDLRATIITGNPVDGFRCYGVFASRADARRRRSGPPA